MGSQSIKIPVELELRQLQGSIGYLQNALKKIKPGTSIYQSIEKDIQRLTKKMSSLEVMSQQTFTKKSGVEQFQKNFNSLGIDIQEVANRISKLSFDDLGDIFSKEELSGLYAAQDAISSIQKELNGLKDTRMKELMSESTELSETLKNLGVGDTLDKSLSKLSTEIGSITKKINEQKIKVAGDKTKYDKSQKNLEDFKDNAAIKEIQGGNFFRKNSEGEYTSFKNGGREALKERLRELGYDKDTLDEVEKMAAANYKNLLARLKDKEIKEKAQKELKNRDSRAEEAYKKSSTSLSEQENYRSKLLRSKETLSGIDNDQQVASQATALREKIAVLEQEVVELKQSLLEASGAIKDAGKAFEDTGNSLKSSEKGFDGAKKAAEDAAAALRTLDNIKFAIKNWFGFNEVINLTKNAVRNMITNIRELDDVMTQIAIVTNMTQQELWNQMGTYSAMAQQYGASIKGVYEVSQLYYQQGLQTAEVMNLTEETLKMAKIANLDYAEATDYMTVAVRGFKMEMSDSQRVTDVYSALAANTASNTEELAVAMSKTASSAEAVGSSFESTSAMIATMIATTREAPEIFSGAYKKIA